MDAYLQGRGEQQALPFFLSLGRRLRTMTEPSWAQQTFRTVVEARSYVSLMEVLTLFQSDLVAFYLELFSAELLAHQAMALLALELIVDQCKSNLYARGGSWVGGRGRGRAHRCCCCSSAGRSNFMIAPCRTRFESPKGPCTTSSTRHRSPISTWSMNV